MIPTKTGCVFACCFKRQSEVSAVHADGRTDVIPRTSSINQWHAKLGHCSETLTQAMTKALGMVVKRGAMRACAACGMGKSRQKNVPKVSETIAPGVGGRLHADISTIRAKHEQRSFVRPNWFMIVDAATGMKFSSFWTTKTGFIEPTCRLMSRWLQKGIALKVIRCDNAGENKLSLIHI